jgi:integrase
VKDAAYLEAKRAGVYVNRVHAIIRKFWNRAAEEKQYTANNPAKFKPKVEECARDRLLGPEEIRALWITCGAVHPAFSDVVKLLLLTGQRLSEIAAMTWSEFHEETGDLRLSGDRTKNKRAHVAPLPPFAIAIIAGRDKIDGCPYVFGTTGKSPVSGFSKWKEELDRRLGLETPFRLHDLRHVAATGLAELEVDPHVIEAVLNHASGFRAGVAGRYNQFAYVREKRVALARWAAHLERLIAPPADKVVSPRRTVAAVTA